MDVIRLAILDMYENTPNQGMRAIREIVRSFGQKLEWELFNVRGQGEVPGLDFDIYISTGGPGNPHDGDGDWDVKYYKWLQDTWEWNLVPGNPKKYVFFICHSFQMAVKHFGLAKVSRRKSMSFGTFPCHLTDAGAGDSIFEGLPNPFYIADFRNWQCVEPSMERFDAIGAEILALEKARPHVPLERAIMAIRFSDEFFGTQFHPEADPEGMLDHFLDPGRREQVTGEHGEDKYLRMIEHLNDSDKIGLTHDIVLPSFLSRAISLVKAEIALA